MNDMFCFNRTFMELKCTVLQLVIHITHRFNRTFMELKWWDRRNNFIMWVVLIVPLWN